MSPLRLLAPPRQAPGAEKLPDVRLLAGLAGVVIAAFVSSIDQRLTSAALPDMIGGFGFGNDEGSWLSTAYSVGDIAIVPLTPWLATIFSPRRAVAAQIVLFSLATVACPLAPDYASAVALRTLQGFGEGGLVPLMLLSLLRFAPPSLRPAAFAVYASVTTLVPLVSEPLAGFAVTLVSWQSLFWITSLLAPLPLFLVLWGMPREPAKWETFIETDYFAIFALVAAAGMLVAALGQGQRLDWFDDRLIVALFAGAGFFTVAFVINELVVSKPLIDLSLFKRRNFAIGLVLVCVFNVGLLGATYVVPQNQGRIRLLRPEQVGLALLWLIVPQLLATPAMPWLIRRMDARLLVATGFGLGCLGSYGCTYITSDWAPGDILPWIVLQACGWPLAFVPLVFLTTSVLQPQDALSGGTLFNVTRNLAISAGPAIIGAIVTVRERVHSNTIVQHILPGSYATDSVLAAAATAQAYIQSYADAFGWLSIILLGGVALVLLQTPAAVTVEKPAPSPSGRGPG